MFVLPRPALALLCAGLLPGCATITRGTTEAFEVQSDPAGADVRLSTGEVCKTPCALEKDRDSSFVVHVEKAGYEPAEVQVINQVAGEGAAGMAGNVIFGGIIGAAVDAGSGAMKELVPNPVEVALEPLPATAGRPEPDADAVRVERAEEHAGR